MEQIQERALRFIYNDYVLNYEELLEKSKMSSLKGTTRTPPLLRVSAGFLEGKVVPVPLVAPEQS